MGKELALAAMLALAACQTPSGSFCAVSHPIRPSAAEIEAMGAMTIAAILAQNEKGVKLCGWKASK